MQYDSVDMVCAEGVSQVTATPNHAVGDRRFVDGEEYVYCYNAGGAAIDAGLGVKLVTGCSGFSVAATSLTDVANPCVGVVKHATMATAEYGWVMVKGFTSVTVNSATTGDYVAIALSTAGKFKQSEPNTATAGSSVVAGYALNADTGAGGSAYAFIRGFA